MVNIIVFSFAYLVSSTYELDILACYNLLVIAFVSLLYRNEIQNFNFNLDGGVVVTSLFPRRAPGLPPRRKTQVAVANFAIKSSQRDTSHVIRFEIWID